MKRALLIGLLILAVGVVGCAKEAEARGNPCDSRILGPILNECSPHTVDTDTWRDEKDFEVGVGLDLILYEGSEGQILNKVTQEYKYDINNGDHQTYTVATMKAADLAEGAKSLWSKIVSFFKRGE